VSYFGAGPANGQVITETLDPRQLGFAPARPEDLGGGEPPENARITRRVLSGEERGPRRDVVLLNAAAALLAGGAVSDLEQGVSRAVQSIDSGAALARLDALVCYSRRFAN
jgi:anthranilate phosphoribosyltransferase